MAQVYGQIESLKQIRQQLNLKGINRFNSTSQIHDFLDSYKVEKNNIYRKYENELDDEITQLKERERQHQQVLQKQRTEASAIIDAKIELNLSRINKLDELHGFFWIVVILIPIAVVIMQLRVKYLRKNYDRIIGQATFDTESAIKRDLDLINTYTSDRAAVVRTRSYNEIEQLIHTKEVVQDLNPLIAGAVGENLVVKEIKKLSDDYILINDFSRSFNHPIYNKKEKDRIYSIQIDHLLISKAGVFVLETKNWSKKSIQSLDLRSPIHQIRRTSFALFVLLNNSISKSGVYLKLHHWGEKKIPIRNVIVMINNKPREEFKYVTIKTLLELNSYLAYFEPIFSDAEVESIAQSLLELKE
jgi:hypothetical protein